MECETDASFTSLWPQKVAGATKEDVPREDPGEMKEISLDKPQFNTLRCPEGMKRGKPWGRRQKKA